MYFSVVCFYSVNNEATERREPIFLSLYLDIIIIHRLIATYYPLMSQVYITTPSLLPGIFTAKHFIRRTTTFPNTEEKYDKNNGILNCYVNSRPWPYRHLRCYPDDKFSGSNVGEGLIVQETEKKKKARLAKLLSTIPIPDSWVLVSVDAHPSSPPMRHEGFCFRKSRN